MTAEGDGRRSLGVVEDAATVTRLRATTWYNLAYVALGTGLGALTSSPAAVTAGDVPLLLVTYAVAVLLVKGSASVADAVHERAVDADNPAKDRIARAVDRLGVERCWSLFVAELVVGLTLTGVLALEIGEAWPLVIGAATALLGFGYSYPPRLKERGLSNHVVTTGVDVGAVVLPLAVLVAGELSRPALVTGGVVFAYTFGYHLAHQAADAHYDRETGLETFATRVGVAPTLAAAAVSTAAAAGFALALGYPLATLAALVVAGWYTAMYRRVRGLSMEAGTDLLAARFDVTRAATALNGVTALSVWRHALENSDGVLPALATVL